MLQKIMPTAFKGQIYICGASGFIGSHLKKHLEQKGYLPLAVSRKKSTYLTYEEIHAKKKDACIFAAGNCHAHGKQADYQKEKILLKNVLKQPFFRVIYLSSSLVYGSCDAHEKRENTPCKKTSNPYINHKLDMERLTLEKGHIVLRLSNIYGPGMSKKTLMQEAIEKIRNNQTIDVKDIYARRDFLYIKDLCVALEKSLNKHLESGIYNTCSLYRYSIEEVLKTLLCTLQIRKDIQSSHLNTCSTLFMNGEKLKKALNWKAHFSLEKGLKDMLLSP